MTNLDLQWSDGTRIRAVQELAWDNVALEFLLADAPAGEFLQTRAAADARFVNAATQRLRMSFHSLVVQAPQGNLLVDTCIGNHKERPMIPDWHQQESPYLQRLAELGLTPADIDYVCCTHLHGDHIGWNTRLESGVWVPTFPNARYLFAADELQYWEQHNTVETDGLYAQPWRDSVLPVLDAGRADAVSSDHEIMRGVQLRPAPGHTPGNVIVQVGAANQRAVLSGDVLHHPVQIERPDWASVFDMDAEQARTTRAALLADIADSGTVLLGAHFAGAAALRVVSSQAGFSYAD